MPMCISHSFVTLTALLLLARPAGSANAQAPDWQTPLFFWGIQRDGAHDNAVEMAVRQRIQQLGEEVLLVPTRVASTACSGPACGFALRKELGLRVGQVLGGSIESLPSGDVRGHLWWFDGTSDTVIERHFSCRAYETASVLPREAARLAVDATAPRTASKADRTGPVAPPPDWPVAPTRVALEHGVRLSVAVTRGVRVDTSRLTAELYRELRQMGVYAVGASAVAAKSKGADDLLVGKAALLQIELAGLSQGPRSNIEAIRMSLAAQGQARQLRFYCSFESCQRQLARTLRINVGQLLDSGEPPVFEYQTQHR